MKPFEKFFYAAPDVRLGNYNVATNAKPAEGRALARELNQLVARHCRSRRAVEKDDEEFVRSVAESRQLSGEEMRLFRLMLIAVKRVLDTSGE